MTDDIAADAATQSSDAPSQSLESNADINAAFERLAQNSGEAQQATPATEQGVGDGTESQPADNRVGSASEKPSQEAKPAAADPLATLDPALRHAARRAGWSEQELREFVTSAKPEIVDGTLNRLYQSYNDISTRFAQMGQQRMQPQPGQQGFQQQQAPQQQATASPFDKINEAFSDRAVSALREEYGDGIVDSLVEPLRSIIQPLQEMAQFVQQSRSETIAREVEVTMKTLSADFGDLYGENGKQPTAPQQTMRHQLYATADQILAGALAQGLPLSVGEALERANMILAAPTTRQRERQKIASSVKERSRQIVARPTQRNGPVPQAGEQRAAASIAEKWASLTPS
jgi:hypothetical protein